MKIAKIFFEHFKSFSQDFLKSRDGLFFSFQKDHELYFKEQKNKVLKLMHSESCEVDEGYKNLKNGMIYIEQPNGGYLNEKDNAGVGAIRIIPPSSGNSMVMMHVDIFDYSGGGTMSFFIGGRLTTYIFDATTAVQTGGDKKYNVRFCREGEVPMIQIGETTENLIDFASVIIRNVTIAHDGAIDENWKNKLWKIERATTLPEAVDNII